MHKLDWLLMARLLVVLIILCLYYFNVEVFELSAFDDINITIEIDDND